MTTLTGTRILSRLTLAIALVALASGFALADRASAGAIGGPRWIGPNASFTWSVPDRFGAMKNGVIEFATDPAYVKPASWPVKLDACAANANSSTLSFSFSLWKDDGTSAYAGGVGNCAPTAQLPKLGIWHVSLSVTDGAGLSTSTQQDIEPRDFLIAVMGDSGPAGEGNPERLAPSLGGGSFANAGFSHTWNDSQCHRSALSGPAQAALRLEQRDPHSSVTFVSTACSGARITKGLLNTYEGVEPTKQDLDCDAVALGNTSTGTPNDPACLPPQVDRVMSIVSGRPLDALLVWIGMNDVQFSRIVMACFTTDDCANDPSPMLALGVDGKGPPVSGKDFLAAKFAALEGRWTLYDQLAAAISNKLSFTANGRVYPIEYPDPTQYRPSPQAPLATCSDDELQNLSQWGPLVQAGITQLVGQAGTISAAEFDWARAAVVGRLNTDITLAAKGRNWTPIVPSSDFATHGYCARDPWFRSVKQSLLLQHDHYGGFHPNRAGHFYGYALPIEATLAAPGNLNVTAPPLPPTLPRTDQLSAGIDQGLSRLADALAQLDLSEQLDKFVGSCFWQPTGCDSVTIEQAWQQAWTAIQNELKQNLLPESAVAVDAFLDDPDGNGDPANDGKFGPLTLDVEGTVTPHEPSTAYEVQLDVTLTGNTGTGLHVQQGALQIDDANAVADVSVKTHLRLVVEPNVGTGTPHAYLDANDAPKITVRGSVQDTLPASAPLHAQYGVLAVDLRGPAAAKGIDVAGGVTVALNDTDKDGKFTAADWQSVSDAFDVSCDPSSHANVDLTAAAALVGISGDVATLKLADSNLCDGVAAPTLTPLTPDLSKFSTLTVGDVVSALRQVVNALHAIQRDDTLQLPFARQTLAQTVDMGDRLTAFLDSTGVAKAKTFDDVIGLLDAELGLPNLEPKFEPSTGRLLLTLKLQGAPTPVERDLDFSRFEGAGLTAVNAKAKAKVTPTYAAKLGLALDLTPELDQSNPRSLLDRVLIQTTGADLSASAFVDAQLDLGARLGPLEVTAAAQGVTAGTPVRLIGPRDATKPMLRLQLTGGTGGYATLTQVFNGGVTVTPVVNARVPHFDLAVKATAGSGTNSVVLGSGKVGFGWNDITATTGADGPQLTTDVSYDDTLLRFDFAHADPQKLIGMVLTALRDSADGLDRLARENETLARSLPMIGSNYDAMVKAFGDVRDLSNQLITLNQSVSLQGLEQLLRSQLQSAFGLTADQAAEVLRLEYDTSGPRPALVVKLRVCQASTVSADCRGTARPLSVPFNLETGNGNGIVAANGAGRIGLDYLARGELDFGVELPQVVAGDATSPLPHLAAGSLAPSLFVLGSSGATVAVRGELNAVASAHLASFEVSLGRPNDSATAKLSARYAVDSGGPATERLTPAAWISKVISHVGDGTFSVHPLQSDRVDCGISAKPGPWDGCAKLPVYIQAQGSSWTKLGEITFVSNDLLAGGTPDGAQAVMSNLAAYALRFSTLIDGLRAVVTGAKQSLDGAQVGQSVPLLGDKLAAGSQVLGQLDQFLAKTQGIVAAAESSVSAGALRTELPKYIAQVLGPQGLALLRDADGSGAVDAADVTVTVLCDATPCEALASPLQFTDVQVALSLGRRGIASTPPFDLGTKGLNLSSGDRLTATVGWKLDLAFGIDRAKGFYLVTGGKELTVDATVALPATLHGELAFLPVTIVDKHAGDDLNATFTVDLEPGAAATKRLYLTDLLAHGFDLSDRNAVALTLSGSANVDLGLRIGRDPNGGSQPDDGLPGLVVDDLVLSANWGSCGAKACDLRDGLTPVATIELKGVKLDLGTTFSNVIRPAVTSIQTVTKPLEPIITEVDKPVPVVNDLSVMLGNGSVSWFDAWAKTQQLQGNDVTAIRTIKNLVTFVNSIPAVGSATVTIADNVKVNVGRAAGPPATPAEAMQLLEANPTVENVIDQIAQETGGWDLTVKANAVAGGAGAKFTFPAFQQPTRLLGLLFGQDVDLVVFDAGPLQAKAEFNLAYGYPFAKVGIAGSASVSGHLALSYDTKGIRELFKSKPITLASVAALVHGFGINDLNAAGQDVPELRLDADAHVYANVGIPLVSVEAQGGVEGNAWLDLHDDDGDGKIRYEDVRARIKQPQCLFDSGGVVQAYARVVITGGPFAGKKDIVPPKRLMDVGNIHQLCPTVAEPTGGELTLDTQSLQFGDVGVGTTSAAQTVTVSNRGKGALALDAVTAPSGFAVGGTCANATLAPGASCAVSVTVTPASGGAKNGNLDISSGGVSTPVALTANAVAPQLSVEPASYDFGTQVIRTVSPSKAIVLRNAGGGVLAVKGIADANTSDAFVVLNKAASKCPLADASLTAGAACTVEVYFAPIASGTQTGSLVVTLADGGTKTVTLTGKGAAPAVSFSPAAGLTFGPQAVRTTSAPQVVTVTNSGDAPLKISAVDGGTDFTAQRKASCPASIAPGATCEIDVRFKPWAGGTRTGLLTVSSNTVAQTDTLALSGDGRAVPVVVLDRTSVPFGMQPLGTTGLTQVVKVRNDGVMSLLFASIAVGGTNAGDFAIAGGTCPTTATAPEMTCTINVRFSPSGTATGPRTAELVLTDAGLDSPQKVQLSGTAIPAGSLSVSPTAYLFDPQRVGTTGAVTTVTLTNNMPTPLGRVSPFLGGAGRNEFHIVSGTCQTMTSIPANGGSCVVVIASAPTARGEATATLSFDSAQVSPMPTVDLYGTGIGPVTDIQPASLEFEPYRVGLLTEKQTVTITNTGDDVLHLNGVGVTGDFVSSSDCGQSLAPRVFCTITIKSKPQAVGPTTGAVTIVDDLGTHTVPLTGRGAMPISSLEPSGVSFGLVPVKSASDPRSVVITNDGDWPLRVSSVALGGTDAADFSLLGECTVVRPGESCAVDVTFAPKAAGGRSAELVVTSDATTAATSLVQRIPLVGEGAVPLPSLSTPSLGFGEVETGEESGEQQVVLKNLGNAPLVVDAVSVSGKDAGAFSVASETCQSTTLAPGDDCKVSVVFAPGAEGGLAATLQFATNADAAVEVSLGGTGTAPHAVVSADSLDFGTVLLGDRASLDLELVNKGTAPLRLDGLRVLGDEYSLEADCRDALAPGDACRIVVTFAPRAAGEWKGELVLPDGGGVTVKLIGTGRDPRSAPRA